MLRRLVSFFALLLVGFFASLSFSFSKIPPSVADTSVFPLLTQNSIPPVEQEQQARELFQKGQWGSALEIWRKLLENYKNKQDNLKIAGILSNMSLAYQQLGQWPQAQQAITESLSRLEEEPPSGERLQVYGQVLNNQGLLQFAQGQAQQALNTWQEAEKIYQQLEDEKGVFRSQINQLLGLQELGLYLQACQTAVKALNLSPFSCPQSQIQTPEESQKNLKVLSEKLGNLPEQVESIDFLAWRRLSNILRASGRLNEAEFIIQNLLDKNLSQENQAILLLTLGRIKQRQDNLPEAIKFYREAGDKALTLKTKLQSELGELKLLVILQKWSDINPLVSNLQKDLSQLSNDHTSLYIKINFIDNMISLREAEIKYHLNLDLPSLEDLARLGKEILQEAEKIGDQKSQSHALGTLGKIYEKTEQWSIAEDLTQQALLIAQSLNIPEIRYRWQWQLGRILYGQGRQKEAIAIYSQTINTLQSIKNDLIASSRESQFSFQEDIEPIYREFINILLQKNQDGEVSQENLSKAINVIEYLQLAELENFFQDACLVAKPRKINEVDQQAAVIYPVILPDRLGIIVNFPQPSLKYYETSVSAEEFTQAVLKFRYDLVVRSKRNFFTSGQKVYQWLLQPLETDLQAAGIKNLVFVPDGVLRNVPLTALYDGQQFLIQKNYNVAITSGLQLLNPIPLKATNLLTLAAGLSESRDGFPPLDYVEQELTNIQEEVPTEILLNEGFTVQALDKIIPESPFSIVHLASHGEFSSDYKNTFILSWNQRIDILELERLLQQKNRNRQSALELLVLSACETATGDQRAALGLAGIAVRSGARSTLATLWSVNDEVSAVFMGQFYQALATKKLNKAEASREAQLSLLANPRYQHPFYWAAYVLVGNWL